MLNIEGLGRQLDPNLDLWATAKPFLERWMNEQVGWRAFLNQIQKEAPRYAQLFPELPRLLHDALKRQASPYEGQAITALLLEQQRTNRLLKGLLYGALGFVFGLVRRSCLLRTGLIFGV